MFVLPYLGPLRNERLYVGSDGIFIQSLYTLNDYMFQQIIFCTYSITFYVVDCMNVFPKLDISDFDQIN